MRIPAAGPPSKMQIVPVMATTGAENRRTRAAQNGGYLRIAAGQRQLQTVIRFRTDTARNADYACRVSGQ